MPLIKLQTLIDADIQICFDLSRSIDLHQISTSSTNEKAVAGITKGLIGLNEIVTWQATHFGIRQNLTSKITAFTRPFHFRDEQVKGAFKYFAHDHWFELKEGVTLMTDEFAFQSPLGIAGRLFDSLVLTKYMERFLKTRNATIKQYAESGKWKQIIPK